MDLLYTLRDLKLLYVNNVQMDLCDYCYKTNRRCTNLAAMRGKIVLMGIIWGRKGRPLYGIEGCPKWGFLTYCSKGDAIGTKVSVRYRESGRLLGVVVKRGSTVYTMQLARLQ